MTTKITPEQELQGFALFVMAKNTSIESKKYELAMHAVLGLDPDAMDSPGDAIWGDNEPPTRKMYDDAIRQAGAIVDQPAGTGE